MFTKWRYFDNIKMEKCSNGKFSVKLGKLVKVSYKPSKNGESINEVMLCIENNIPLVCIGTHISEDQIDKNKLNV